MIVITTPTGDIGGKVLKHVLSNGQTVRVIARDPSKLSDEIRNQVEVVEGSHGDAATLDIAFAGADAVFWLVPPDMSLDSVDEAYVGFSRPAADAIKKHGVKRVVVVSALGRGWPKEAGLVTSSIKADDLLASTGVAMRTLTMPSFMDNLLGQADSLREDGTFSMPLFADKKMPTVATSDIAAVAAECLLATNWTGQAEVPVLGPEDLSQNDLANIVSEVLDKPIQYKESTMAAFSGQMLGYGMSQAFAQGYSDMMTAKNEGIDNVATRPRTPSTPTTFRKWAETVLKPVVNR